MRSARAVSIDAQHDAPGFSPVARAPIEHALAGSPIASPSRYSLFESDIIKQFRKIYLGSINALRIRHHGDYHLGNLLYTGKDFLIVDFEGEPALAISERRLKHSPLRDVAGMIRSFHYAAYAALGEQVKRGRLHPEQEKTMDAWARFWSGWVGAIFYQSYCRAAGPVRRFCPPNIRTGRSCWTRICFAKRFKNWAAN